MWGALNATFITLIPEKDSSKTLFDLRAISLCNLVYKMVTKINADMMKRNIYECITNEQFVFLTKGKILDTIGTYQECLHSFKTENQSSVVMRIDLANPYDKFN